MRRSTHGKSVIHFTNCPKRTNMGWEETFRMWRMSCDGILFFAWILAMSFVEAWWFSHSYHMVVRLYGASSILAVFGPYHTIRIPVVTEEAQDLHWIKKVAPFAEYVVSDDTSQPSIHSTVDWLELPKRQQPKRGMPKTDRQPNAMKPFESRWCGFWSIPWFRKEIRDS